MDLFEAIEQRRSVRAFESVDVSQADLERIVDAGRRAPSGMNTQPLEYVVVRDRNTISELSRVQGFIASASAAVAIVADPDASKYWLEDASAAAENMLLAITALGLASCWVEGTLLRQEEWAKKFLGVPKKKRLIILLPIGKATSDGSQAGKKSLGELIHWEKY